MFAITYNAGAATVIRSYDEWGIPKSTTAGGAVTTTFTTIGRTAMQGKLGWQSWAIITTATFRLT